MDNINTTYCKPANLIPHFWYYRIVNKDGRADLPCIMLLSEIFGWFRKTDQSRTYTSSNKSLPELTGDELALTYEYLTEKLNLPRERIRRSFIKLEKLGIVKRSVRNVVFEDGRRNNKLFITINDKDFFTSCFLDPEYDIRVGKYEKVIINSGDDFIKRAIPLQNRGNHISKKNKKDKNRSIGSGRSNFYKINSKEKISAQTSPVIASGNKQKKQDDNQKGNYQLKLSTNPAQPAITPKQLKDFYPLSKKDCYKLQSLSGRDFTLNAMNEILRDMSERVSDRFFYSRKGFFAYMTKVLTYEMRDSEKTGGTDFQIRSNQDTSRREIQKQESYLTEIESSLQVSPEWHLKKKLASVLARDKAYNVLTAYKHLEITEDGICILSLSRNIELTANDREIILSQVRAIYERMDNSGNYISINSLSIKMPDYSASAQALISASREYVRETDSGAEKANAPKKGHCQVVQTISTNKKLGIWEQIRKRCVSYCGESGRLVDRNWLSKLSPQIDDSTRTITLQAPSEFIRDWIEEKYEALLTAICAGEDYNYAGVMRA